MNAVGIELLLNGKFNSIWLSGLHLQTLQTTREMRDAFDTSSARRILRLTRPLVQGRELLLIDLRHY